LAYESGITRAIDAAGGSFYLEHLTDALEEEATDIIEQIEALGGAVRAIEAGHVQREIEESAWRYQREIEEGERVIVGLNRFTSEEETPVPVMKVDPEVDRRRAEEVRRYRATRDASDTKAALTALLGAARGEENLFPYVLEAFRKKATLGEVTSALREVWGEYQPGG
ncbi:methylmalonyl-CoA mutase family protein, partial [Oceanithermus sp.]